MCRSIEQDLGSSSMSALPVAGLGCTAHISTGLGTPASRRRGSGIVWKRSERHRQQRHAPTLCAAAADPMRALITVFDKRAVVEFAQALQAMGVAIVSTGGTARKIAGEGGVTVTKVEDLTGFPEIVSERGRERGGGEKWQQRNSDVYAIVLSIFI